LPYKNGLKLLRYWFWLFIIWKNEQKNLYDILGHCITDGRECALSLRPIKGAGFCTTSLTKVDNYSAKISFRGMCTVQKSIRATFGYFDVFLYETFSFIFCLGLDFFKWKKEQIIVIWTTLIQSLLFILYRLY